MNEFINELKIVEYLRRVRRTNDLMTQISSSLGYYSSLYFTQVFTSILGYYPLIYGSALIPLPITAKAKRFVRQGLVVPSASAWCRKNKNALGKCSLLMRARAII